MALRPEALFISDLHLTADRPAVVERFLRFCHGRAAGAERLYILGDLFDAYLGDDNEAWPHDAIRMALRRLSDAGTAVFFQHGNRDFLLGERFCRATGTTLLPEAAVVDLYGTPALLQHGDLLCTDDLQYQAARRRVRSPAWQAQALGKPLWLRQLYARWYRFKSGLDKGGKTREIMDVNGDAVAEAFRRHGVRRLIHGHTHRPGRQVITIDGMAAERWVLPEWNGREWLLVADRRGLREEPLA
ncbi:UDP-2,3-diacylglucosamine diphosphatase [Methyloparacoccus murrellii]